MGSGKTSVAKYVAEKLNCITVDTDQLIEENYQTTIPEIFSNYGEATFRNYEKHILQTLRTENLVVATGGGIVETEENSDWMKNHGVVIYLETSWEQIVERLQEDQSRPIWNNRQIDKQLLLQKRNEKYQKAATHQVITDGKMPDELAEEILELIKQ